ncbi:zinc-ribbon domain-containing protein [Roseicitreum antarcticum]|uniref:MJ0042 family finger-like domain-containing protein n=1 Tax=Roseicitreum antarcticum TaxID=564137 RepID=A0A1H3AM75_9RHOB|nr:zinc-ribbon domain-containing protein [Roseicitreum antarcticum]SDX30786.1 MJ0042 family finger-like domain-containing protein [Roseicitreum antarcticum]
MRLICPNCDAHYEVGDDAIPDTGRDVQCSACGHAWFQTPSRVRPEALSIPKPTAWKTQDTSASWDEGDPQATGADAPPAPPAQQAPAPQAPVPTAPAQRKPADDETLEILRQEAAYEAQVRARERATLESQPDLGLRVRSAPPALPPEDLPADVSEPPEDPVQMRKQAARRALPDIDDISSTLQPVTQPRRHGDRQDLLPPTDEAESRGFTTGFIMVTSAVMALAAVYVAAPNLADAIPGLADVLERYTATVDLMRIWVLDTVNGLMQSATEALNSDTGNN